jgi:hypothetical protein
VNAGRKCGRETVTQRARRRARLEKGAIPKTDGVGEEAAGRPAEGGRYPEAELNLRVA